MSRRESLASSHAIHSPGRRSALSMAATPVRRDFRFGRGSSKVPDCGSSAEIHRSRGGLAVRRPCETRHRLGERPPGRLVSRSVSSYEDVSEDWHGLEFWERPASNDERGPRASASELGGSAKELRQRVNLVLARRDARYQGRELNESRRRLIARTARDVSHQAVGRRPR